MKLALISDIHSNFIALEACLAHMRGERFDRICVLGDMIAYGPRPKECVEAVRALQAQGALCLKGNHDDNSVRQGTPGGVSSEIGRYELLDRAGMGEDNLRWVDGLPAKVQEGELLFVHASPRDPLGEYVDSEEKCLAALAATDARWVFCGHSHRPMAFSLPTAGKSTLQWPEPKGKVQTYTLDPGARHVINVGSVGESRDGDPRAVYTVVDTESGRVEFRRVDYDIAPMIEDMKQQGFPEALWRKRLR
jgi:diadenosine tetraphosphatase ApaH/serine/threonine PP2A family protein phosphatase